MHWQAFMVNRWGGAAQPVNTKVDRCIGLIIGNHHIVQGGTAHTLKQKKTVVCEFLDALAE